MGKRIAQHLVRHHRLWLLVAAILAGISFPLSSRLNLDWAVESMFPAGDPLVVSYRQLQERFGGNDICLAVYRDPELWDPSGAGLERLARISTQLAETEGVRAVLSLAELHGILQRLRPMQLLGLGSSATPLLDPDDKLAQELAEVFEGYTHRRDSDVVAIACILQSTAQDEAKQSGPAKHEATLGELRQRLSDLPSPATDGLITGEPVLVAEGFKMVQRDGWRLGAVSSVLVSLVLLLCFRSIRWTLIPLAVVHWSLLVTRAVLVGLELELTMISSTLTAIVTVIGVATSMHLLLKYQERRRHGLARDEALEAAVGILIVPIFWACVTDAVGFSALLIAGVGPVRDFGLMMAIGSMMVFISILLLVPGLALIGSLDADPSTPRLDFAIRLYLRRVLEGCLRRRPLGLIVLGGLLIWATVGSTRMKVETDFTKNFASHNPIVQGYNIVERELGGAGVWDVMLPAPAQLDAGYVQQVLALEKELRGLNVDLKHASGNENERRLRLTKVLSIADAVQAATAGPMLSALPVPARLQGMRAAMPEFTGALLTESVDDSGHLWLRIMLRSQEHASASAKGELVRRVRATLQEFTSRPAWREQFPAPPPQAVVAGYHVMLGQLVASVLKDQWNCFLLAALGIYLAINAATRSWKLALAALITNSLPILLVLGTMGWLGIKANMGVAMIAAVSLGLSVDSSIHYLLHYRRRLATGERPAKCLRSAQENVGLAVVLATVALIAGFVSLCISEFVPTVVFGTLASLTMLGSLLGNLIMLPLLIAPRSA